jgi:hypothetical protein
MKVIVIRAESFAQLTAQWARPLFADMSLVWYMTRKTIFRDLYVCQSVGRTLKHGKSLDTQKSGHRTVQPQTGYRAMQQVIKTLSS